MEELIFVKDYKKDGNLRKSFSELATKVFGISFEEWYQRGFWNDRYIPYSFQLNNRIIANVSINLLGLVVDGKVKKHLQIGTVMTDPDYRNQGLSAKLLQKVIEDFEDDYDVLYLFANKNVLDFYPKFGFKKQTAYDYYMDYTGKKKEASTIKKLDGKNQQDLAFIYSFAAEKAVNSYPFSALHAEGVLLFYCLNVFNEHIYYIEDEEVIVIYEQAENQLELYEILSKKEINMSNILKKITNEETAVIHFHFTPSEKLDVQMKKKEDENDVLFIKAKDNFKYPDKVRHPIMAKA